MTYEFGQALLCIALLLMVVGGLFCLMPHIRFLGRLPGDLNFDIGNVHISAPIVTCLLLSVLFSLFVNLFARR
jgi:hypothetical protein